MQLGEVQEQISEIKKLNAEVIAIASMGDQQDVEKSKRLLGLTFTLIPTPNYKITKKFGVVTYATIIIDKSGIIRFKGAESAYSRTSTSRIIKELQGI